MGLSFRQLDCSLVHPHLSFLPVIVEDYHQTSIQHVSALLGTCVLEFALIAVH